MSRRPVEAEILYKLGGLTVSVTDEHCDSCGRSNLAMRFSSKRRSGAAVIVCHLCMREINERHIDYRRDRKPGAT